ncbi:hypothetical protein K443DRAFT_10946 [Laccaria amethystina LaAM-08-1]|uniref:Uncharacterized protein n=1 Tax=Laccaria amethystina LaAM-08-1 TaxID=1095629 RepID=A0A0C9X459_9AGAR|nr:hypothetical protein K443DRAFT_10946 [Laccaria amethystina LaAM-08-1]
MPGHDKNYAPMPRHVIFWCCANSGAMSLAAMWQPNSEQQICSFIVQRHDMTPMDNNNNDVQWT